MSSYGERPGPAGRHEHYLAQYKSKKNRETENKEQLLRLTFVITSFTYKEFTAWGCYM